MRLAIGFLCLLVLPGLQVTAQDRPKVQFHTAERIALVGNEFFERDQDQGYIETALTTRFPKKNLTFRNLGYSGDSVYAEARSLCSGWATFGPPGQGFERLKQLVLHVRPTLIFVAYGMNESFDGPGGLDHFVRGLDRMLDMLGETKARIVMIGPIRHENLGPPLPDPVEHNRNLRLYIDAMEKVAQKRGYPFIDPFDALGGTERPKPPDALTSDGIHLTAYGYWRVAGAIERELGYGPRRWEVTCSANGQTRADGTRIDQVKATDSGLSFHALDTMLPLAPPRLSHDSAAQPDQIRILKVSGLRPGRYALKSDNQTIATASADQWARGVQLHSGPAYDQEEHLRRLVIAKNLEFFNYWRPQNDTYIFGYRKQEQGRNAVEISRFEPLTEAKDAEIARLRIPQPHAYTLSRVADK